MNKPITIGTRGSQLALYQANKVKSELEAKFPDQKVEIEIIKTKGDKILDVALSKIGDKGLFTKEIENALLDGRVDLAVHSLKDLPTVLPDGLKLGGVLKRAEFRDAFVSVSGKKIAELDEKTDTIATSSLRRRSQLLKINPNFNIVDIRGNVNTRLRKMSEGHCTAMIMAAAGLQRIGLDEHISEVIEENTIIPAVSQGIIAIEIRGNDDRVQDFIDAINDSETSIAGAAERVFLNTLEGGCQVPVGCYTKIGYDSFFMKGFISMPDGTQFISGEMTGGIMEAKKIAKDLALSFYDKGASKIIEFIREMNS
jgi:hydroxymethylbilane synthase